MEENILSQPNLTITTEEKKTHEEYLAFILRLRSEIDTEQIEIERLKADNLELKAETSAILTTLKTAVLT